MPALHLFISYSHDSDAHRDFVLSLSNRLRADGLDCQIDQYVNGFPAEGWQLWMETQVEVADFVLVVCTPLYLKRYRGLDRDGGRGVTFEGVVISQTLYDHYYQNTKFVPVLPEGGVVDDVPLPLKGFGAFGLMGDYVGLYRFVTGQPEVVAPGLGERVELSSPSPQSLSPTSSGFSITLTTPRFTEPGEKFDGVKGSRGMSYMMRSAWIGGVFVLLGAIIAGLWSLGGVTHGDCSSIFSGDIEGNVSQTCGNKGGN